MGANLWNLYLESQRGFWETEKGYGVPFMSKGLLIIRRILKSNIYNSFLDLPHQGRKQMVWVGGEGAQQGASSFI